MAGRAQLARSIDRDLADLTNQHDPGFVRFLVGEVVAGIESHKSLTEVNAERAEQVVRSVAAMERATRAVALVHMYQDEPDAARTALDQFQDMLRQRQLDTAAAFTALNSFAREDQKPILARVLSSHDRALEICGAEPVAVLMPSPGDVDACESSEEGAASAPVPACSECRKDIEPGKTMCAYHRGKHRENNTKIAVRAVSVAGGVAKFGPKALKVVSTAGRLIRP